MTLITPSFCDETFTATISDRRCQELGQAVAQGPKSSDITQATEHKSSIVLGMVSLERATS